MPSPTQYDGASRLIGLFHNLPGANDLVFGFSYNPASQIVQNTRSNNLYSWTQHGSGTTSTSADGLNRIASWEGTIGHDAKGNINAIGSSSYGYSSEHLMISAPANSLAYAMSARDPANFTDPLGLPPTELIVAAIGSAVTGVATPERRLPIERA